MKKQILLLVLFAAALTACRHTPDQPVVILFDNDVHCAVSGYARMAALRCAMLRETPYVTVVSAGDFAQGSTIGSLSEGAYIVDIMNSVPYDITTIGNHEFDYGIEQLERLTERLTAEAVCCNISRRDTFLFPAWTMRRYGSVNVAFVGAATPTTFTSSTPTYFQNAAGEVIYSFHRDDTFELIQQAVDDARSKGADYVIVLSHLGDDTEYDSSVEMIAATRGIDAVLDGHAHHVLNQRLVNADGDSVLLTSTGTAFLHIGRLTIDTRGHLQAELLPAQTVAEEDSAVLAVIAAVEEALHEKVSRRVGESAFPLLDCSAAAGRLVRREETNLTDFFTDAIRYTTGADIAFANGGGFRMGIPAGEITYGHLYAVWPFNNTLRVLEGTGQQLLDALEMGVKQYPKEDGDFLQVSGLRYEFDASVPTSVAYDANGLFDHVGETRRITRAEVERAGKWEPLHPDSLYTIGGQSYIMVNKGASGTFAHLRALPCEMVGDVEAVIRYLEHLGGTVPAEYAAPQKRITRK